MLVDFGGETVTTYQVARLKEGASPKSINEEVGFMLRLLGERGDAIRAKLRREKALKLKVRQNIGKAYAAEQKSALLAAAVAGNTILPSGEKRTRKKPGTRSPFIRPAIALAFNCGIRDKELRELTIGQIDLGKKIITVGPQQDRRWRRAHCPDQLDIDARDPGIHPLVHARVWNGEARVVFVSRSGRQTGEGSEAPIRSYTSCEDVEDLMEER